MSQKFIDEVRAIVLSNFSDENFGVRELSSLLGLSSSQTLRKVKAETGKSVTQYIRELRLEKAAKLLKKTDHTIAEISYQVGFSSASYFNKTFSKYYGIAPGEYKTKSISLSELTANKPKNTKREVSLKTKIFFPVVIGLILVIGYLLINPLISKNTTLDNSIAVLPFKDFSPEDSQWFSDGVSDNILHSLAQMKDMKVISFTSSSTYRDTDKQIPEIAKELGVSYILEGSVTLVNGKIKVITQLINSNDEHIWSKEYNENFEDVIAVQNNVAQEVMKQLKVTLSPQEEIILKEYPTKNMEAYSLYLQGKNMERFTKEEKEKKIELYNRAILLDSTFAEAYGEIAYNYYELFYEYSNELDPLKIREKAHLYADKALSINPNIEIALLTKGNLYAFVDWNKSFEYFDKALSVNPNNFRLLIDYAANLVSAPNKNIIKHHESLAKAFNINPLYPYSSRNYISSLIYQNKLESAEKILEQSKFLLSERKYINYHIIIDAKKNKNYNNAIKLIQSLIDKEPQNAFYYNYMSSIYSRYFNDIENVLKYSNLATKLDSNYIFNEVFYLVRNKKFKKAKGLMATNYYQTHSSKKTKLNHQWLWHYYKEEYQKSLVILNDPLFKNDYNFRTLSYAQLGDQKKVDSMDQRFPWGDGKEVLFRANKATQHAILKNKDSMYYYLDNIFHYDGLPYVINRKEMDPYRNEERFKAFQRKWYLPVSGE